MNRSEKRVRIMEPPPEDEVRFGQLPPIDPARQSSSQRGTSEPSEPMMSESPGPEITKGSPGAAEGGEIRYTATFLKSDKETLGAPMTEAKHGRGGQSFRDSIQPGVHELHLPYLTSLPGILKVSDKETLGAPMTEAKHGRGGQSFRDSIQPGVHELHLPYLTSLPGILKVSDKETLGAPMTEAKHGRGGQSFRDSIQPGVHELHLPYLTSLPGILKMAQILLSFVTFVCSLAARRSSLAAVAEAAWIESLAFASAVLVFLSLLVHLGLSHLLATSKTRQGVAFVELCVYAFGTLWWLIGAFVSAAFAARINSSVKGYNFTTAAAIACILCILAGATFAAHAIVSFLQWTGRSDAVPSLPTRSRAVRDSGHVATPATATPLTHQSA